MGQKHFALKTRLIVVCLAFVSIGYTTYLAFLDQSWHLTELRFNSFALISLLAVILNLSLLLYTMTKIARTEERMWLALYQSGLIVYSVAEMMQRLSGSQTAALFWGGVTGISLIAAPAIYLFALAYTNQSERRYTGVVSALLITGTLYFFYECFTNIVFINNIKFALPDPWGWDFRTAIGPASGVLLIWYDVTLVCAMARLISFRRSTRNAILRKQSLLFIFAVSLPLIGGTITDLVMPMVGFTNFPSLGATLGVPAAFIIIYGLLKYQLLTISPTSFANTILTIMKEAVVVTDSQFNVVYMNSRAEAMLGAKAEGKGKTSLLDMVEKDSLAKFQQAFTGGTDTDGAVELDRIDLKPAHADAVPVKVTSTRLQLGNESTRVMVLADITNELHIRGIIEHEVEIRTEQLNKARAYLVSSINSLVQGFILVDRKATVELANGVAARWFGVTSDEATSKPLTAVVQAMKWDVKLSEAVDKVLESKRHKMMEASAADGSFYQIFITPILAGERELGATIVIENITERKIMDRSKDEFFSIASHELRTPLTAIRGNMGMAKDYFPDAMKDESLKQLVSDTHEASVRLIEIVNDFLDSSRLEQGKLEFDLKPFALKPVVEAAEKDLDSLLKAQGATFDMSGLDKLPQALGDEGRVRQIIFHLLSNAVKYGEKQKITVSGEADTHSVKIRVTDTGKGISPEGQKMLFHKFQQAGDSILTRDNTKGTGLGLYISRLLAQGMHGTVVLERTEEGKGSAFVLTLPRK